MFGCRGCTVVAGLVVGRLRWLGKYLVADKGVVRGGIVCRLRLWLVARQLYERMKAVRR